MQIIFQYLFFTSLMIIRFISTYTRCPLPWNISAYWYFIIAIKTSHIFHFSFRTDKIRLVYIVLCSVNTFYITCNVLRLMNIENCITWYWRAKIWTKYVAIQPWCNPRGSLRKNMPWNRFVPNIRLTKVFWNMMQY